MYYYNYNKTYIHGITYHIPYSFNRNFSDKFQNLKNIKNILDSVRLDEK